MHWEDGPPELPGLYWLRMEDQGGWPYVTIGYVYVRNIGVQEIETWIILPECSGLDKPIKDIWNIYAHMPAEKPPARISAIEELADVSE